MSLQCVNDCWGLDHRPPQLFGLPLTDDYFGNLVSAATTSGWSWSADRVGQFATVLIRRNAALKLYADDAYTDYLDHLVIPSINSNPFFPQLDGPPIVGHRISAVFLERLDPLPSADLWIVPEIMHVIHAAADTGRVDVDDFSCPAILDRLGASGVCALDLIVGFSKAFGWYPDFSNKNIMLRPGTRQIVFSDPLSSFRPAHRFHQ